MVTIQMLLPDRYINDAKKLIDTLDQSEYKIAYAFWLYFEEAEEFRLVISSEYTDVNGPKKSYEYIQKMLSNMETCLNLIDITVTGLIYNGGHYIKNPIYIKEYKE